MIAHASPLAGDSRTILAMAFAEALERDLDALIGQNSVVVL